MIAECDDGADGEEDDEDGDGEEDKDEEGGGYHLQIAFDPPLGRGPSREGKVVPGEM